MGGEREGNSYYAQQRYYRPGLGRFNRIDPWEGDEASPITLNKYLYANGNPLVHVDPDGRQAMGETLADRHFMEVAASGNYSQEEIQALARRKMEIEAELSAESLPYVALAVPGTLLAKGLWSVGRATYGAYRAGGAYHAANVAAVEGAALTESAILTGVGVTTGAEVPSVMSAPATATRRLMQTAGGLDASLDALQPLQRVASQAELPVPQASLLSSSAAANRVQRAQPVTVAEGASLNPAVANSVPRLDYSANFAGDLRNFNPGYAHFSGALEDDLLLVQFHRSDRALGQGRSAAWWTTPEQANRFLTVDDVRQGLALPPGWGPRDAVSVARIPRGAEVEYFQGSALKQMEDNTLFEGGGVQYRFRDFDPNWIIQTRKLPRED